MEVSDEAIQIFEGLHAMDMVSAAYSNKATALAWLGKEKEALVNYKVSLELMDGIDAPHSLGLRFFEYGIGGKILGNSELATEMLTRAEEIFKQIGAKANEEEAKDELKHL